MWELTMERYLVVANQTLGGEDLDRVLTDRMRSGTFWIVVPMTEPKHEAEGWSGEVDEHEGELAELSGEAAHPVARSRDAEFAEARRRAEQRLDRMLDKIRSAGGTADGNVGDPDPATAVKDVLKEQFFNEVIISTLPAGISRWLKMDLPSRVARMTEMPVTTIEAEG